METEKNLKLQFYVMKINLKMQKKVVLKLLGSDDLLKKISDKD